MDQLNQILINMIDQNAIVYAAQEGKNDPIYINLLRKTQKFEKIEISKDQAMRLALQLLIMLQPHIKN